MNHLVVIGGFTEGKSVLDPVMDEAIAQGFGYDGDVLRLRDAWRTDEEILRAKMAGAIVVTHSAGLLAVPDARNTSESELPAELIVVAAPEPRTMGQLFIRSAQKTSNHLNVNGKTTHRRSAHLQVVVSNTAELLTHPLQNARLVPPIRHFSTVDQLSIGRAAATGRAGNFMMKRDEYYTYPYWQSNKAIQYMQRQGIVFAELPGIHDELLVDPRSVLQGIGHAFAFPRPEPALT